MAAITLSETPESAVVGYDKTRELPTTSIASISPTFSSITRVTGPADPPSNYILSQLDVPVSAQLKSEPGFLRGRRPPRGLLFPRGYYNR